MDNGDSRFIKATENNLSRLKDFLVSMINSHGKDTDWVNNVANFEPPKGLNEDYVGEMSIAFKETGYDSAYQTLSQIEKESEGHEYTGTPQKAEPKTSPWMLVFDEALGIQVARYFESIGETNKELLMKGHDVLIRAIYEGIPLKDTIESLGQIFTDYSYWRLETIARTNASEAANWGRVSVLQNAEAVAGYQYEAILDERTTPLCQGLSGKYFSKDDPAMQELVPPNHYNCRSYLEPVFQWDVPSRWGVAGDFVKDVPEEFRPAPEMRG